MHCVVRTVNGGVIAMCVQYIVCFVVWGVYCVRIYCTLCSVYVAVYNMWCVWRVVHCIVCTVYCVLCIVYRVVCNVNDTLCIVYCMM